MKAQCGNESVGVALYVPDDDGANWCGWRIEMLSPLERVNFTESEALIEELKMKFSELFREQPGRVEGPPIRMHVYMDDVETLPEILHMVEEFETGPLTKTVDRPDIGWWNTQSDSKKNPSWFATGRTQFVSDTFLVLQKSVAG